jgi:hypothetical protein
VKCGLAVQEKTKLKDRGAETRVVGRKEGTMKTGNNKTDNVRINVILRCVRVTIFFRGKAISITYSECVSVALITQHAKLMRLIILSSVARLAVPYFSTLSNKEYNFRKNLI